MHARPQFVRRVQSPLAGINLLRDRVDSWREYPYCVPTIRKLRTLSISSSVCFFVGENGSGKSTLLEAIADNYGLGTQGGSRHMSHTAAPDEEIRRLSRALRLSWRKKPRHGYFLRTESFFNVASYIDEVAADDVTIYDSYGGKSLHEQSHGESFLALFQNRFGKDGFYLLDEPETALSPQRQLSFLVILHQLASGCSDTQFIIATHSPIILSYPGAQIFSFDSGAIEEIAYRETEAYKITSGFLSDPELYLNHLLAEVSTDAAGR